MTEKSGSRENEYRRPAAGRTPGCDVFDSGEGSTRRAFAKAGLTAPVLLTLASRPAWAGACSESGRLSGNLSNIGETCEGEGCSASFWAGAGNLFHPNYPASASFSTVFGGVGWFGSATLLQVVNGSAAVVDNNGCTGTPCQNAIVACGQQAVAALQNAATDVQFELTVPDVIATVYVVWNMAGTAAQKRTAIEGVASSFAALNNRLCPYTSGRLTA